MADKRCPSCGGAGRVEPLPSLGGGWIAWTAEGQQLWPFCVPCGGSGWLPQAVQPSEPTVGEASSGILGSQSLDAAYSRGCRDGIAAERSRCAKIADTPLPDDGGHFTNEAFQHGIEYASQLIAEQIRSGE